MKYIRLAEPSTFFSREPVKIFDERKNLFYFHPNREGSITFNLPKGVFYTNDNVYTKLPFEPYEIYKHHVPGSLTGFKIKIRPNPKKCTINLSEKTITIDPSVSGMEYWPAIVFVFGHEAGHIIIGGNKYDLNGNIFFDAEKACDEFSKNWMLATGYNPSQIQIASKLLLSNFDRKQCIHNSTAQQHYRR